MSDDKTDFDQAFTQFAQPEAKTEDKPAEVAPAETVAEGGDNEPAVAAVDDTGAAVVVDSADDAVVDGGGDGEEIAAKAEPGAADAVVEEKPAEGPSDADEILARLTKLVKDSPAEEKPAEAKPAEEAVEEKPVYSKEEQEFLDGYTKDWGDVVRGEELRRRGEYRELLQFVFAEVGKYVSPLRETVDLLAERTHRTDIKTTITDYSDDLRDQVINWAKSQPTYLQAAYNQVIQQGTVDEVRDLVDRYRKETGKAPVAKQKPTEKKGNELSSEAKKAAEALAPVETQRSGVQQPSDPSNFDEAWKQFAKPDQG